MCIYIMYIYNVYICIYIMYIHIYIYICNFMYTYTHMICMYTHNLYMIYIHDLLQGQFIGIDLDTTNLAGALCRSFVQESLERSRPGRQATDFELDF